MFYFIFLQSSRARKNEADYREPTGSDDGVENSESDDDVSLRSESSNPPQPATAQLEIDHIAGGPEINPGDVDHRTTEGAHVAVDSRKSTASQKLYLFSGGGFCVPDEEDEISGLQLLNEGQSNGHVGSSQRIAVDPVTSSPGLRSEDLGLISETTETLPTTGLKIADLLAAGGDDDKSAQVDTSGGSGLRAIPFFRRKKPSKQP